MKSCSKPMPQKIMFELYVSEILTKFLDEEAWQGRL